MGIILIVYADEIDNNKLLFYLNLFTYADKNCIFYYLIIIKQIFIYI